MPSFSGIPWLSLNKVYDFVQTIDQGSLTTAGPWVSSVAGAMTYATGFSMSQLAQSATFIALFDQYRIAMVEVVLSPRANVNTAIPATAAPNPGLIYAYVDVDDANAPGTVAVAQQRQNVICESAYKPIHLCFVPHVSGVVGGPTSTLNLVAPWLDTSSAVTLHYGVKAAFTQSTLVNSYDLLIRVHMQFRNVL